MSRPHSGSPRLQPAEQLGEAQGRNVDRRRLPEAGRPEHGARPIPVAARLAEHRHALRGDVDAEWSGTLAAAYSACLVCVSVWSWRSGLPAGYAQISASVGTFFPVITLPIRDTFMRCL